MFVDVDDFPWGNIWVLCEVIAAIVAIIWFILAFFNGDMEQDIIDGILTNYIKYISLQDVYSQMFI